MDELDDDALDVLDWPSCGGGGRKRRARGRRSLGAPPKTPRHGDNEGNEEEEEQGPTPKRQYRGVNDQNPFAKEFPGTLSNGKVTLAESIAIAAYVLYGANQRDDKTEEAAHETEVRCRGRLDYVSLFHEV